jgi:hypothetical protein
MAAFIQTACVVALLTVSTAVAQPAARPSKTPLPDRVALSSGGGLKDQLKQEGGPAEQQPVVETATDASQQAEARVRESLWHRWNDLP